MRFPLCKCFIGKICKNTYFNNDFLLFLTIFCKKIKNHLQNIPWCVIIITVFIINGISI